MPKYYQAYEKRYKQVHKEQLSWASYHPSPIVLEMLQKYSINQTSKLLELGCGEGRDSLFLLKQGYDVLATDVSEEAIHFCVSQEPKYTNKFMVMDACSSTLNETFDFIYSVAVIHILVLQEDRNSFLKFIKTHLNEKGIALILTMGDGKYEHESDIKNAFKDQIRKHQDTGRDLLIAGTSCKMVNFSTLELELKQNGLEIIEKGLTSIIPDFPTIMYVLVR